MWTGGSHGGLIAFFANKGRFSRVLPAAGGAITHLIAAGPHIWALVPEAARIEIRSVATGKKLTIA